MPAPRKARCVMCNTPKRLSAFAPSELAKNKMTGRCRDCNRARRLKYAPDQIARLREWEAANPERNKEKRRLYRMSNPERKAAIEKRRKLRLKANGGSHTAAEWVALCEMYGHMCLCCGATDKPLTRDHVKPIMQGGGDCIENLQPLCADCNSRKGGRWIDYRVDWQRENDR